MCNEVYNGDGETNGTCTWILPTVETAQSNSCIGAIALCGFWAQTTLSHGLSSTAGSTSRTLSEIPPGNGGTGKKAALGKSDPWSKYPRVIDYHERRISSSKRRGQPLCGENTTRPRARNHASLRYWAQRRLCSTLDRQPFLPVWPRRRVRLFYQATL